MSHRPIYEIAREIERDYASRGKPLYFGAVPYVKAMRYLDTMADSYGADSAGMVLATALSNLGTWRGETAKRVKNEMREMLGLKQVK